jgi:hypothetical protein
MTRQIINTGGSLSDGSGDTVRTAFQKVNANFNDIYARDAVGSDLEITGNEITAVSEDTGVQLTPNGEGHIIADTNSMIIADTSTPSSATGASGDLKGMVAWDDNYIYVCTADYDGSTPIWKRAAIATWVAPTIDDYAAYTAFATTL